MALIRTGNARESSGEYAEAEAAYLGAIARIDAGDRATIGALYINLGTNAESAGRDHDAIGFFDTAIQSLEGERGDALLQSAHAHYNLAKLLLGQDDPRAVEVAEQARRRYERHPFAATTDLADAAMLETLARIFLMSQATEAGLRETWTLVRRADAETLNQDLLVNFLLNWLHISMTQSDVERFEALLDDLRAWAPPVILARVLHVLGDSES
jgi:hypothetical protein